MRRAAFAALFLSSAGPTLAEDFTLISPVDCTVGEDQPCYIQNYMDRDPGPGFRDFACQQLGYDGHKGTDFALRSQAEIAREVSVFAAADGTVKGVRDGMADRLFTPDDLDALEGRDCGNGVVIDHGDGWETQYCHLRNGSVSVEAGDKVSAGDPLGVIGLSGRTQFPHLHLSLRRNGEPVDPFAPDEHGECAPVAAPDTLWSDPPTYQPGGVISAGFSTAIPDYEKIKAGDAHEGQMAADAPALVLWGFVFGSRPGDILRLQIAGPDGAEIFSNDAELTKHQAQVFRAGGRRTEAADWFVAGTYSGTVTLLRDGQAISDTVTDVLVAE